MNPLYYTVLHLLGAFLLFTAFGAALARRLQGQNEKGGDDKLAAITHGIAMLMLLVGGFGAIAGLALEWEAWLWIKLVLWVLMGGMLVLIRRLPGWAVGLWWLLPLLAAVAAYLGIAKPAL